MNTAKNNDRQACADKVHESWKRTRDSLDMLLDPKPEHYSLNYSGDRSMFYFTNDDDLGGIDLFPSDIESAAAALEIDLSDDDDQGLQTEELVQHLFENNEDAIREAAQQSFCEYGLSFDYVSPYTFEDQPDGYWRYQISWGGPSTEIRFYGNLDGSIGRIEYWYLDWFDGACIDVTPDDLARSVWQWFVDTNSHQSAYDSAREG